MATEIERLLDQSPEPHVIIDAEGRYQHINPAAREILGVRRSQIGDPSPFSDSRSQELHGRLRQSRIGWTAVEFSSVPFAAGGAEHFLIRFAPMHGKSRREKQLDAIVAVAGALSEADQLDTALSGLAHEVRTAVDLESCALTLLEPDRRVRIAGTAGLPDDYAEQLEACRQRGAPLLTVRAVEENQVIIDPQWRNSILADERWAPLHETIRSLRIGTLIAAPLRVRDPEGIDDILGALTVFCREDVELGHDDIAFLRAMTDYASIAISNARMFRRLREQGAHDERLRLSRELHDSVTQELFSLSLRTRALIHWPQVDADPTLAEELNDLYEQSRRALDQMRATILRGRAVETGAVGVVQALRTQCAQLALPPGLMVEVRADDEPNTLVSDLQDDVFHLTMEAVRNAVQHSNASRINVGLARGSDDPTALHVEVIDDGNGFARARRSAAAVGLDAMRERAETHGGTLTLTSEHGRGTTVTAVFPAVYSDTGANAEEPNLESTP